MPAVKATNPFYVVLLAVGAVFAITACAYGVMTVRGLDPQLADEQGLMGLMSRHGLAIMVVQLVLLGVLTVAAIATDDYWMGKQAEVGGRRSEVRGRRAEGKDWEGEARVADQRAEPIPEVTGQRSEIGERPQ